MYITKEIGKKRFGILFIIFIVFWCAYEIVSSRYMLEVKRYRILAQNLQEAFSVTHITDLHGSIFGDDNCDLVQAVKDTNPDIILITGDMINEKKDIDQSVLRRTIKNLVLIAPVYFSYGNQEKTMEETKGVDMASLYSEAGAIVLDRDYMDITIKGQSVRMGGIYGYCLPVAYAMEADREDESEFLIDFQNTNAYKILMCHMPVSWLDSGSLYDYDIDCVFSGHAHGGQIRLPFIGGLWAPDQGWFPGRECGVYETDKESWMEHRENMLKWAKEQKYDTSYYKEEKEYHPSYLVLSRGLGNTEWIPRFHNIPEIVAVDFVPEG